MLLIKSEIERRCQNDNLIDGWNTKHVQPCSYDLTLGSEYYVYKEQHGNDVEVSSLSGNQSLCIPANAVCYVISEETLKMPLDLAAEISLAFGLIRQGIMLSRQPPIDPGYEGKIVAMLHNLSNQPVYISSGQHIVTVVFYQINQTVGYTGNYNKLDTLTGFVKEPVASALSHVYNEVKSKRERLEKTVPWILTATSVSLAMLVFLASTLGLFNVAKQTSSPDVKQNVQGEASSLNTFKIGTTENTVTVLNNKDLLIYNPSKNSYILVSPETGTVQQVGAKP